MLFGRKKKSVKSKLPNQKKLKETCLRPGRKVDLIVGTNLKKEIIDIRSTTLHMLDDRHNLVLSQTFPPVSADMVGRILEITFLIRLAEGGKRHWLRAGYKAELLKILPDYSIGRGRRDNVLIVPHPKELGRFTLRLNFRLTPPSDLDLRLHVWSEKNRPVEVLDISQGGVRFAHPPRADWSVGDTISLVLLADDLVLNLTGNCVRGGKMPPGSAGLRNTAFTSVSFVDMTPQEQHKLGRLVNNLARYKLSQRANKKT
jgi:hypothetical protein